MAHACGFVACLAAALHMFASDSNMTCSNNVVLFKNITFSRS